MLLLFELPIRRGVIFGESSFLLALYCFSNLKIFNMSLWAIFRMGWLCEPNLYHIRIGESYGRTKMCISLFPSPIASPTYLENVVLIGNLSCFQNFAWKLHPSNILFCKRAQFYKWIIIIKKSTHLCRVISSTYRLMSCNFFNS